jgi:hypothetical protein
MASLQFSRFILLALLPVIAFALYLEGQSYDPALISFTLSDISTGREAAFFPREVGGFNKSGQVRLYTKENLHEYINGHAEYFISAGFIGLAVGEYILAGTEPAQSDIVVDIYDMGKGIHAFGVLTDEIGDNPATLNLGMMGAKTAQGISFISGKYYVRIASFQDTLPIDEFAQRINEMIGSSKENFTVFSRLPDLGEVVTTRFVKEAYRGLSFANNVVEREYRLDGKTIQVSLFTGSEAEMKKLISSYLAFFKDSETPYKQKSKNGHEMYRVMDQYEGDWYLLHFSDSVFGIYGEVDDALLDRIISNIMSPNTDKKG